MKRLIGFFSPDRSLRIGFVLFLAAVPFFVFYRTHHFGIYGHFKENLTILDRASDCFWEAGFVAAVILGFRTGITFRYIFTFALAVGFLLVADPRNLCGILILPVTGALCVFALACLLGWLD